MMDEDDTDDKHETDENGKDKDDDEDDRQKRLDATIITAGARQYRDAGHSAIGSRLSRQRSPTVVGYAEVTRERLATLFIDAKAS